MAVKGNKQYYIWVAYLLNSCKAIGRECSVLKSIWDNYSK